MCVQETSPCLVPNMCFSCFILPAGLCWNRCRLAFSHSQVEWISRLFRLDQRTGGWLCPAGVYADTGCCDNNSSTGRNGNLHNAMPVPRVLSGRQAYVGAMVASPSAASSHVIYRNPPPVLPSGSSVTSRNRLLRSRRRLRSRPPLMCAITIPRKTSAVGSVRRLAKRAYRLTRARAVMLRGRVA